MNLYCSALQGVAGIDMSLLSGVNSRSIETQRCTDEPVSRFRPPRIPPMATIRKFVNKSGVRWRAEVEVRGRRESKRFPSKPEAVYWAQSREAELIRGHAVMQGHTVGDALRRYSEEYSAHKRSSRSEQIRIKRMLRDPLASVQLTALSIEHGEDYRDRRLETVKPDSCIRELTIVKSAIKRAVRWNWLPEYPWGLLENPKAGKARTRVFTDSEIRRITDATDALVDPVTNHTQRVGIMLLIAIETAMRQAEICGLTQSHVNLQQRTAHLPLTKNGEARTVPLSSVAVSLIERCTVEGRERIFPISANTASTMFTSLCKRLDIKGAHFHDSRRNGTIKLSKKLSVLDLARVTGHKDIKMLMTYYQSDAAALAMMLD